MFYYRRPLEWRFPLLLISVDSGVLLYDCQRNPYGRLVDELFLVRSSQTPQKSGQARTIQGT